MDASYAVHPNMRGHTGATMTLGKCSIFSLSTKQKLNAKSSTEAELIGINNVISQIIWTQHFLEERGYSVAPTTIYQDNKSTMIMGETYFDSIVKERVEDLAQLKLIMTMCAKHGNTVTGTY